MKTNLRAAFCVLTALCVMALTSGADAEQAKKAIRINGAGMACDQVQLWAEAFAEANPDSPIVVTGSSAGKGFEALFEKNADVALASRVITAEEQKNATAKGMKLDTRLIGYAGLAIVTSNRNPLNELSMDQLRKVFTGEYTNWNQLGGPDEPIRCLTRRIPESGGAMFFLESVLHNQPYGKTTVFTESWTGIMKVCSVAKDLPIGMGPRLVVNKTPVKVIGVKEDNTTAAILPTEATMKNKTYPIVVPIRLYWDAQSPDDRILKFVDFCAERGLAANNK